MFPTLLCLNDTNAIQSLFHPLPDTLHEPGIQSLVVVLEVYPAAHPSHYVLHMHTHTHNMNNLICTLTKQQPHPSTDKTAIEPRQVN